MFIDVHNFYMWTHLPFQKQTLVVQWSRQPGRVSAGHCAKAAPTAAGGSSLSRDISRFLGLADL